MATDRGHEVPAAASPQLRLRRRGPGAARSLWFSLLVHTAVACGLGGAGRGAPASAAWRGAEVEASSFSLALRCDPAVELVAVLEGARSGATPPALTDHDVPVEPREPEPAPGDEPFGAGAPPERTIAPPPEEPRPVARFHRALARAAPVAVPADPIGSVPAISETAAASHPAQDGGTAPASVLPGGNVPPRYPFVAWRRHIEGSVLLELDIGADGLVVAVRLVRTSGCTLLDEAAVSQLGHWTFSPARGPFGPVASTIRQEVVFRIRE